MKSILQIGKYFRPQVGGMETAIESLSLGISKKNYRIKLIYFTASPSMTKQINKNLTLYQCKSFMNVMSQELSLDAIKALHQQIKMVDLIHIHMPNPLMEWALLKIHTKKPIVCTYHCEVKKNTIVNNLYKKNILSPLLKKSEQIIVSAPKNINFWGLDDYQNKISVIPFGSPSQLESIASKPKIENPPYLVFVGRLVPYKGLEYLIDAMQELDFNLVIIGDGPEFLKLNNQVDRLNLTGQVKLLGKLPQKKVNQYLSKAWATVLPSIDNRETFGISLIESLSHATPLLTSDLNTGVTDINKNNITGLHFRIKSTQSIVQTVKFLQSNKQLYSKMQSNCLEHYKKYYQLEDMISKHEKLYGKIL